MEAEHHHAANVGLGVKSFNHPLPACDLSARKRPIWAIYATLPPSCHQIDRPAIDSYSGHSYVVWMKAHIDHFRFLLLNRPSPRVV
jgi:hypothetical protein